LTVERNVRVWYAYFIWRTRTDRNMIKTLSFRLTLWHSFWSVFIDLDLDLDLDSSRIRVDTLSHTSTPLLSVESCHLCFLPGEHVVHFLRLSVAVLIGDLCCRTNNSKYLFVVHSVQPISSCFPTPHACASKLECLMTDNHNLQCLMFLLTTASYVIL